MKNKNNMQKLGGIAAIYMACSYIAMIAYFLVIIDYASITDAAEKIQLFIGRENAFFLIYLAGYVVFGLALIVISFALYERLKKAAKSAAYISTALSLIWACLLIASGMVTIRGIHTAAAIYPSDPAQAIAVWISVEAVSLGLSFSDGEILGGLWMLVLSIAAIRTKVFAKPLNILGIIIGAAGILSAVPAINDAAGTGVFGIGQIAWFIWLGIALIKAKPKEKEQPFNVQM
ncbi:MAG: DUF4386 family protein [Clostridia bacterium]|nr:DUF4386 family protein [Clostridia bacterium]